MCSNVSRPSGQLCAEVERRERVEGAPRVVFGPLRRRPLDGGAEVGDVSAELVAGFAHPRPGQRLSSIDEPADVVAGVAFTHLRRLVRVLGEPVGGVLPQQLVQLVAPELEPAYERLGDELRKAARGPRRRRLPPPRA